MDISWIGAGSADCFFHSGIHCWDMAAGAAVKLALLFEDSLSECEPFAGAVIVREAGGIVLSPDGSDFDLMGRGIIAAASAELGKELAANIKVYKCGKDMADPCFA